MLGCVALWRVAWRGAVLCYALQCRDCNLFHSAVMHGQVCYNIRSAGFLSWQHGRMGLWSSAWGSCPTAEVVPPASRGHQCRCWTGGLIHAGRRLPERACGKAVQLPYTLPETLPLSDESLGPITALSPRPATARGVRDGTPPFACGPGPHPNEAGRVGVRAFKPKPY